MGTIDTAGNIHRPAGAPGAVGGQFAGKVNSTPSTALTSFNADEAGCDSCGIYDRVPGAELCAGCAESAQPSIRITEDWLSASALSQAYIDGVISATVRDRVAKDLGQRWRAPGDETAQSLREILVEGGIVGKNATSEGPTIRYWLSGPNNEAYTVSKATWDYFDQIPDSRLPSTRAQQEAQARYDMIERRDGTDAAQKDERANELYAAAERFRKEEEGHGVDP